MAQLRGIYTGKITNWKDARRRGRAASSLYGRENNSGTYVYFKEHVLDERRLRRARPDPAGHRRGGERRRPRTRTASATAAPPTRRACEVVKVKKDDDAPAVDARHGERPCRRQPIPSRATSTSTPRSKPRATSKTFVDWVLSRRARPWSRRSATTRSSESAEHAGCGASLVADAPAARRSPGDLGVTRLRGRRETRAAARSREHGREIGSHQAAKAPRGAPRARRAPGWHRVASRPSRAAIAAVVASCSSWCSSAARRCRCSSTPTCAARSRRAKLWLAGVSGLRRAGAHLAAGLRHPQVRPVAAASSARSR